MPQEAHPVAKRLTRRAALSAGILVLCASVQAAPPRLTVEQLTATSGAGCDSFYPSMNGAGTRVAFTSFCDLVGLNADGNAEVFVIISVHSSPIVHEERVKWDALCQSK